jgi:hypothetical protein
VRTSSVKHISTVRTSSARNSSTVRTPERNSQKLMQQGKCKREK